MQKEQLKIEEKLGYYKGNRSFQDVLLEEFAFSLIFNNIAQDKVDEALKSVGLEHVPNIFLLIQVDDYSNESKRFALEEEFVMKVRILDIVRSQLRKSNCEFIAANLTGTDKMIALLSIDNKKEYEQALLQVSEEICEKVHFFTNYTVSICMSDICKEIRHFSKNYERANTILQESFYLGKRLQTKIVTSPEPIEIAHIANKIDEYTQSIYVSLSTGNHILFGQTMVKFFNALQNGGKSRERSQLLAGRLIDKMEEYVVACGAENKTVIAEKAAGYKETIFSCRYADDICLVMMECYEAMREILEEVRGRAPEDAFRETVNQYVKDHFKDRIYLDEIALRCGYSKYYFCRQMKKCFGIGLSDHVNRFRIERAKELLCSGYQSIEDIVRETGFSSANYFEIVFRKAVGMSPTAYRRENRK